MCEESDDTTVLAKVPTWNHACNIYYNYMLERFREDWLVLLRCCYHWWNISAYLFSKIIFFENTMFTFNLRHMYLGTFGVQVIVSIQL